MHEPTPNESPPQDLRLATIWHRFCAVFVDGVLVGVPITLGYFLIFGWPPAVPGTLLTSVLIGIAFALPYLVYDVQPAPERDMNAGNFTRSRSDHARSAHAKGTADREVEGARRMRLAGRQRSIRRPLLMATPPTAPVSMIPAWPRYRGRSN